MVWAECGVAFLGLLRFISSFDDEYGSGFGVYYIN